MQLRCKRTILPRKCAARFGWFCFGAFLASAGCKPVQSMDTVVANTQLGFVSKSCGENAPYFVANKNMCQDPDVRFTLAAVAPDSQVSGVPLLALSKDGLPAPLIHLELGFLLRDKDSFEKLQRQFGSDPEATRFAGYTHFDGTPRKGVSRQYYRVTDLLGPGFQALSGQLWTGQPLVGSWSGVYAALSATPEALEFPLFDAATYLSLLKPRAAQSGGISFVKAFQESDMVPVKRPEVNGQAQVFQRTPEDETAVIERNRGLLPGDVLLVMRRSSGAASRSSASAPVPMSSGARESASVKSVLAASAANQEKDCFASGQLVHTAVLVEKDAWFESIQTRQGGLFRIAPFDDVVLHSQLLGGQASLGNLCFGVVRRDRVLQKTSEGSSLLQSASALPLASLLPNAQVPLQARGQGRSLPVRLALGALLAAPGATPPLATKYEDSLVGRVLVLPVAPGQAPLPLKPLVRGQ